MNATNVCFTPDTAPLPKFYDWVEPEGEQAAAAAARGSESAGGATPGWAPWKTVLVVLLPVIGVLLMLLVGGRYYGKRRRAAEREKANEQLNQRLWSEQQQLQNAGVGGGGYPGAPATAAAAVATLDLVKPRAGLAGLADQDSKDAAVTGADPGKYANSNRRSSTIPACVGGGAGVGGGGIDPMTSSSSSSTPVGVQLAERGEPVPIPPAGLALGQSPRPSFVGLGMDSTGSETMGVAGQGYASGMMTPGSSRQARAAAAAVGGISGAGSPGWHRLTGAISNLRAEMQMRRLEAAFTAATTANRLQGRGAGGITMGGAEVVVPVVRNVRRLSMEGTQEQQERERELQERAGSRALSNTSSKGSGEMGASGNSGAGGGSLSRPSPADSIYRRGVSDAICSGASGGGSAISMSGATAGSEIRDRRQVPRHMSRQQLQLHQVIGRGTFGLVYRATWRGIPAAVKVMQLSDSIWGVGGRHGRMREQMAVMEAALSSTVSHPNIVQVYTYMIRPVTRIEEVVSGAAVTATAERGEGVGEGDSRSSSSSRLEGEETDEAEEASEMDVVAYELLLVMEFCELVGRGCVWGWGRGRGGGARARGRRGKAKVARTRSGYGKTFRGGVGGGGGGGG